MAGGDAPPELPRSTRRAHLEALERRRLALFAADGDRAAQLARLEQWIVEVEGRIAALEGRPPAAAGGAPR